MSGNNSSTEPHTASSEWQVNGNDRNNTSICMIPMPNSMMDASNCSSAPVIDSFCHQIYGHSIHEQNLGFCDMMNLPNDPSTSSSIFGPVRTDVFWTQPNTAMLRGNNDVFPPTVRGTMIPPILSHLPTDSGCIERAARFSCFSGGNFGYVLNSFNIPGPLNLYSSRVNGFKGFDQTNETNRVEVFKEATPLPPGKNKTNSERDEAKDGVNVLHNGCDEAFNGQEEMDSECCGKGLTAKKRKRTGQDLESEENNDKALNNQAPQRSVEAANKHATGVSKQQQGDHIQTTDQLTKPGGKNCKKGSQGSDQPKEGGYIHVRARRGQATNSHSLAERVRREKISERMKCLQDLVPGCSKVTGKAVMLDEIINYVQSLQRQVEFLSMKLATVNPRLDFNIEGLIAKDILQPRPRLSSSSLAFHPNTPLHFPPLHHHSQPGLVQTGFSSLCNYSSETLQRSKVSNVWEDELHNVVNMDFESSAPLDSQDLIGSQPPGTMKVEPDVK